MMFDVNEDGDLIYNNPSGSTSAPGTEDGSLYDAQVPSPAPQGEGMDHSADDVSADLQASPSPAPDSSFEPVIVSPDVSGGDALSLSGDLSLTTSGDVYIYPDMPEASAAVLEDRSVTSATVTGLPNTTSTQYLEDVARGYPSWYKYMAFKSDSNYSQSMVLYIGATGEKNPSQNRINFTNVDRIEVNYVRDNYSNYYQYSKTHYDSYQIPYNSDVFLYTNVVDGYAEFDIPQAFPVSALLFLALAMGIISLIIKGGGKR